MKVHGHKHREFVREITVQEVGGAEADRGRDVGPDPGGGKGEGDRTGAGYQGGAVRVGNYHGGAA